MLVCSLSGPVLADSGHASIHRVDGVAVETSNQTEAQELTVRIGPFNLGAHAGPMVSRDLFLTFPFAAWIIGYEPRIVDEEGAILSGHLLHHVVFINTARRDLICETGKEVMFIAGSELTTWSVPVGVGYPMQKGQRIRIWPMLHNPTDATFPTVYLEVRVAYKLMNDQPPLHNIYPAWFFVGHCSINRNLEEITFDLPSSESVNMREEVFGYSGQLLWSFGHLHDFGRLLRLENVTRKEEILTIHAQLDSEGHLLSIPTGAFSERGKYRLNRGEVVRVTAVYGNPTGKPLVQAAMGIVGTYFLPDNDEEMVALEGRRR